MDYECAERPRRLVHCSRLLENAIKRPLECYFLFPRMREHAYKPTFYRPTVEVFYNMENSQDGWLALL